MTEILYPKFVGRTKVRDAAPGPSHPNNAPESAGGDAAAEARPQGRVNGLGATISEDFNLDPLVAQSAPEVEQNGADGETQDGPLGPEPPPAEPEGEPVENLSKPVIQIIAGDLAKIATQGERALIDAGIPIYRRSEFLVRPVVETVEASHGRNTKTVLLTIVQPPYLRDVLSRVARWEKFSARQKGRIAADPPHDVCAIILARFGEWTFSPVSGVISTPTLRPDGSILSAPGYDPVTRLILVAPPALPDMPPTRDNAEKALQLLDGLLDEFPFVDEASRSVALSGLITPIVRAAMPVVPMHVGSAHEPGSGKSYLWDISSSIATGHVMPVKAAGRTEEETEKRLSAAIMAAQPLICIDNLNGELGGDFICQAVERQIVDCRILGKSQLVRVEARGTTFFCTGNNIVLRGDMTRRAIRCGLDPKMERPELRQFKGDPVATVLANRGRYIAAAFCIVRAYLAAGQPNLAPKLASFEGWSDYVRSALIWLGRADPIITMETARAEDPERAAVVQMLAAWETIIGTGWGKRCTAAAVVRLIEERGSVPGNDGEYQYLYPDLRDAILATAPRGRAQARSVGNWLRRHKGKVVTGKRFTSKADDHGHGAEWWIETL